MVTVAGRCLACGECREHCPFGDTFPDQGTIPPQNGSCTLCGCCVEACPTGARQLLGQSMTVEQVMEEVWQDRVFYEDSGGGVTFSGGEPLMQPEFLLALLESSQDRGLHTAVDTCGFVARTNLLAAAPRTDLFLYDLKFMDQDRHRRHTGVSNTLILENLRALSGIHDNIWIRVPVIPGLNDDEAELEAIASVAGSIPGIRQVNLLPYHKIGNHKFERLGQTAPLADTVPPSTELMERARSIFTRRGLTTRTGG